MNPALRAGVVLATAAIILVLPIRAQAGTLRWLVPDRVPSAPFEAGLVAIEKGGALALPSRAVVEIAGGRGEELGASGLVRTFRITPSRSTVRLEAVQGGVRSSARIEVGPPPMAIRVTATPPAPVKGQTETIELSITTADGEGRPAEAIRPVLRSNVGSIGELVPDGMGRWRARYRLPEERYPEVAIVVAFLPWPHPDSSEGAFGSALIPLSSAVSLPGRTEPNVSIAVEIAGRTFGPVRSDAEGHFELPVVVPPGHRFGTSIATDRVGNRRRKRLDLRLPPTDQLACVVNPARLPADGVAEARILCVATDPYGRPVERAKLQGSAELGTLRGPTARGGGAWEWELTSPASLEASCAPLHFEFPAGGPGSRERLCPLLTPLAATAAEVKVEPSPVFLGTRARVQLRARDRLGREAPIEPELRVARGRLGSFKSTDGLEAGYTPPERLGDWRDTLFGVLHQAAGGEVATFHAALEEGRVAVQALDVAGRPVAGVPISFASASHKTDRRGVARFEPGAIESEVEVRLLSAGNGFRSTLFLLRGADGLELWPARPLVRPIPVEQALPLAPPAPVDVRVELSAEQLRYAVRTPSGEPLHDREVVFEVVDQDGARADTGPARVDADGTVSVPLLGPSRGTLVAKVTDVATGVSASRRLVLP